ncbi:MAG: GerMN domain-containing protein [Patescibacteria group bacterium]
MKMRLLLFFLAVVGLSVGLVVVWKKLPLPKSVPPTPLVIVNNGGAQVVEPAPVEEEVLPEEKGDPAFVLRARPTGTICDAENAICVDTSYLNRQMADPIMVTGTAIAWESRFAWQLVYDASGMEATLIDVEGVPTDAPDMGQPGPFQIRAFLPWINAKLPAKATLVLFEPSPKDGSPTHVLRIPVLLPTQTRTTKIFLSDLASAETSDCSKTVPVTVTIPQTKLPMESTLRRLLQDESSSPLATDTRATQIPEGTKLISLVVANGTATAEFSQKLDAGGGSCHVSAVRAQIEATLKQFPGVKNVVISVEGKSPEETLQP